MKILFVTSEAAPLIKTGGLADVSGSLPAALHARGHDVRVLLPAYRDAVANAVDLRPVARMTIPGIPDEVGLLEAPLADNGVKAWLVDYAPAYDRPGHPYLAADGNAWQDNAERFALLARAAVAIARNQVRLDWRPDVVHCNDWQTGLVPALLARPAPRPATLFTIHNLAYQGIFPGNVFVTLGLAPDQWSADGLEFFGQLSFIKGGLVFADRLTTVSPTYAREIQTPEYGCGLDGLLRHRGARLRGILNGADYKIWNPATDPLIPQRYDIQRIAGKANNKHALQAEVKLPANSNAALIGMITRLVDQKGIDLVLDVLPDLVRQPVQLVILGTGERRYEQALQRAAARHPEKLAVHIEYNEALAHRIESGADIFLMPSRFEPCGLNQLYSLRYGTLPVVRRTGGLADTVVDAGGKKINHDKATGFVFSQANSRDLFEALNRALALYSRPQIWRQLVANAMRQDFSWKKSAKKYEELYEEALKARPQ